MGIGTTCFGLRPFMSGPRRIACIGLSLWLFAAACTTPVDKQESVPRNRDPSTASVATSETAVKKTKAGGENKLLAGDRVFLQESWDTVWTLSGSLSDTVFLHPLAVLAVDSTVYVAEYGNGVVLAMDAATGSVRWTAGRRGNGPREFIYPVLFKTADGMLGVADARNQRISALSADGTFARETRAELPSVVIGVCQLGTDVFIAGSRGRNPALLRLSATGDTLHKVEAPWLAYLDELETVAGQFRLTQISTSQCALVPILGPSEAQVFDQQLQVVARVQARERVPTVTVDTQALAGGVTRKRVERDAVYGWGDVAIVGESAFIVFEGSSTEKLRLIDEFSLPDFSYVGTHLAPHRITSATGSAHSLTLLMEDEEGYFRIAHLRRRSATRASR